MCYLRASLVPAAAVIPAPIVYIKVVAVKKIVVVITDNATGLLIFLRFDCTLQWSLFLSHGTSLIANCFLLFLVVFKQQQTITIKK